MNISLSVFGAAAAALKQISYFFVLFASVGHCFFGRCRDISTFNQN